ncbi:MAG: SGNH/GDSL hydrolase family protein, partial [Gorillibacterium sp.]|nr:SGNH/GDSL hydrolase family protein [Gorillibacterium sp.]
MKKTMVLILLAALVLFSIIFTPVIPSVGASTDQKVMPLGDSITDGYNVPGGYRVKLWNRVVSSGLTIEFVGSMSNGPSSLGDKNHEGHSGWRIAELTAEINGWLDASFPQTVLLQIGTNDILQNTDLAHAPERLSSLIDLICAKLPTGGKLYVATITPLSNATDNQEAVTYNNAIPSMVQAKVSQGKPVYLVNMYNALTTADLADGVHPNATGYDKIGTLWFTTIQSDLAAVPE